MTSSGGKINRTMPAHLICIRRPPWRRGNVLASDQQGWKFNTALGHVSSHNSSIMSRSLPGLDQPISCKIRSLKPFIHSNLHKWIPVDTAASSVKNFIDFLLAYYLLFKYENNKLEFILFNIHCISKALMKNSETRNSPFNTNLSFKVKSCLIFAAFCNYFCSIVSYIFICETSTKREITAFRKL